MKNYWNSIKNGILYAGVTKTEYHDLSTKVSNYNLHVWKILSMAEVIMFLICYISSFSNETVQENKIIYLIMLISSILIETTFLIFGKKLPKVFIHILIYISISFLVLYGLAVGTLSNTDLPGITFMVMLVIAPMLVIGRPWIASLLIIIFSFTYIIIAKNIKTGTSLELDIYNSILFSIVSLILHFFMSISKMRGLLADYKLERLTTYDGLTGLENELSYVQTV